MWPFKWGLVSLIITLFSVSVAVAQHKRKVVKHTKLPLENVDSTKNVRDSLPINDTLHSPDSAAKASTNGLLEFLQKLRFGGGISADYIYISEPNTTYIQNNLNGTSCVTTGSSGWQRNFGFMGSLAYDRFEFRLRYSDLSGHLDSIYYDFRALGLELGYRIPVWSTKLWGVKGELGLHLVGDVNINLRSDNILEGIGIPTKVVSGAPRVVYQAGIGMDYQLDLGNGIRVGPEFQFKPFLNGLLPGDDGGEGSLLAFISAPFDAIGKLFGSGNAVSPYVEITFTLDESLQNQGWQIARIYYWFQGDPVNTARIEYGAKPKLNGGAMYSIYIVAIDGEQHPREHTSKVRPGLIYQSGERPDAIIIHSTDFP